ncbi:MAG TPA: type II toxin-antitoxin system HicB family antitoxin [Candidatus Dojkabacteria bacterium]|jgi:predicted RNase H-like HicB family nuclease
MSNKRSLKAIVWREGENYISQCINVEVSSFGKTKEKAIENLKEALKLYFEDNADGTYLDIKYAEVVDASVYV